MPLLAFNATNGEIRYEVHRNISCSMKQTSGDIGLLLESTGYAQAQATVSLVLVEYRLIWAGERTAPPYDLSHCG